MILKSKNADHANTNKCWLCGYSNIEDKASGTQLIQELIEQGLHAVTRYQPQTDKSMLMHAQTAMIENGLSICQRSELAFRIPA